MCYSEFADIINSIVQMDADGIYIECSRSHMELLDAFEIVRYPNGIGPGIYDIHSPRVPEQEEIETLLRKALVVLSQEQLWVNPGCGLKLLYFFDPYGIYATPDCYPPGINDSLSLACVRYPVGWIKGKPQFPARPGTYR